jgi:DNA-binding IclR family transcriptional regulator
MTKTPKNAAPAETTADAPQPRSTKISSVTALLQRAEGATLSEITEATGWQKHTARAALSGLKKKGHTISKASADGATRYTIDAVAQS